MSDWLERELARELAPVTAPHTLGIRLGFAPAKRWEFPRVLIAVAAAVVMVIGAGYAASRTAALDLRHVATRELRGTETVESCLPGERVPAINFQVNAGNTTVLVAHVASAVPGTGAGKTPDHALAAATEAGCHLCHAL